MSKFYKRKSAPLGVGDLVVCNELEDTYVYTIIKITDTGTRYMATLQYMSGGVLVGGGNTDTDGLSKPSVEQLEHTLKNIMYGTRGVNLNKD